ncbi:MAG: [protein-PII] uridylyltransferase [Hyphomicrobiaceae bacterium]
MSTMPVSEFMLTEASPPEGRVPLSEDLFNQISAIQETFDASDECRREIVALLKTAHTDALVHARTMLDATGSGMRASAVISDRMDAIVAALFRHARSHVFPPSVDDESDQLAIVATGGYGRGHLAPFSDIDLLFVVPFRQSPWGESVAEYILYVLWDLGLKVGHATRNIEQCVRLSNGDMTIRTALVDARFIDGTRALYDAFDERFWSDVRSTSARTFVEAKMRERDQRHERTGKSRFLVEPNVKDGKGGLRDLHTIHWLSKYLTGKGTGQGAVAEGVFLSSELATLRRCEDFLWTVRCHMHFLANRAEERLTFDLQPELAARLHYRDGAGLRAVERFMKHYFHVAKDVGDLTRTISTALELRQLKAVPQLASVLNPLTWTLRRKVRQRTDFRIESGRIQLADPKVLERDPLNLLRIYKVSVETGALFHPETIRRIRLDGRLMQKGVRRTPEAARLFLELLCDSKAPEDILRRMHAMGVLGRVMPEFQAVTAMMQFNMYHHYTVDEHLLRTVGELRAIESGAAAIELPVSTDVFPQIKNRRVLYLAALIHDIGKGRPEDHSIAGARLARTIAQRLGLTSSETELAVWLVREHLAMSSVAQSRDLADPRTISDFAARVGNLERLRLLLLLTVADIRAVGPGTWNGWKGQLLRQLYYATAAQLTDDEAALPRPDQVEAAQAELRAALSDWVPAEVEAVIARHYDDYWLRTEVGRQVEHAKLLREIARREPKIATAFRSDAFTEITELMVIAPNHPRLLALFSGCCAAAGANIIGAQINTTRDGLVIDDFQLQRAFPDLEDENRRARRISDTIERVLKGEVRLAALLKETAARKTSRGRAFDVPTEIHVDNTLSDQFTVIDVSCRDRPGLLYTLTSVLSDLNLDINSARITTYGERAQDAFYVTDLTSRKIIDPDRKASIAQALHKAIEKGGV